jgi:hypothetical protein
MLRPLASKAHSGALHLVQWRPSSSRPCSSSGSCHLIVRHSQQLHMPFRQHQLANTHLLCLCADHPATAGTLWCGPARASAAKGPSYSKDTSRWVAPCTASSSSSSSAEAVAVSRARCRGGATAEAAAAKAAGTRQPEHVVPAVAWARPPAGDLHACTVAGCPVVGPCCVTTCP